MSKPMMKCGHAANSTSNGKPACVICAGIKPGWNEIDTEAPSLEGRKARCGQCQHIVNSNSDKLAFFEHRPEREFDSYYCGCRGWD
jgi:hypothetical protein